MRKRKGYLVAKHHRLAPQRDDRRAIVAGGHTILAAVWYILRDQAEYRDLGPPYFNQINHRMVRYNSRRLAQLG